jgi:hypothetical protein
LLSLAADLNGVEVRVRRRVRRWVAQAGLLTLACSATVIGFVFLAWAVYLYADAALAPPAAAALAGAAALVVAGLLLLAGKLLRGRRRRRSRRAASAAEHDSAADAAIEALLSGGDLRSGDVVMTSLVAGIVLGASPALRRKLAAQLARRGRAARDGADEPDAG